MNKENAKNLPETPAKPESAKDVAAKEAATMPRLIVGRELYDLCEFAQPHYSDAGAKLAQLRAELGGAALAWYLAEDDVPELEAKFEELRGQVAFMETVVEALRPAYEIFATWPQGYRNGEFRVNRNRPDAALTTADPAVGVLLQAYLEYMAELKAAPCG